jgi:hypothetical protein
MAKIWMGAALPVQVVLALLALVAVSPPSVQAVRPSDPVLDPAYRPRCDRFLPQLLAAAQAHTPGETDSLERMRCLDHVELALREACTDIVETYGLEHVRTLLAAGGSDAACEFVARGPLAADYDAAAVHRHTSARGTVPAHLEVTMLADGADLLLADAAAGGAFLSLGLASAPPPQPQQGGAGAVAGLNAIGGGLSMLGSQVTTEQMHLGTELDSATDKLRRAEARNRALNRDMRQLRKETWRAQPGHCDCCDGCLAPE